MHLRDILLFLNNFKQLMDSPPAEVWGEKNKLIQNVYFTFNIKKTCTYLIAFLVGLKTPESLFLFENALFSRKTKNINKNYEQKKLVRFRILFIQPF